MKRVIVLLSFAMFLFPVAVQGADKNHFFEIKQGVYFFTGDLADEHPMGYCGEIVYGYKLRPHVVLEGGVGYLHDGVSKGNDVRAGYLAFTVKGVYPGKNFEPFAAAGVGIYSTKYKGRLNGVSVDDSDTVLGGHFSAGADYKITSNVFIGIEGKYIFTGKAEYNGVKVNLNGLAALVKLGIWLW